MADRTVHCMMFNTARAWLVWFGIAALAAPSALADRAADLVRIHIEAIGGKDRVEALSAMRAVGRVVAGGKMMHFTMIAARPDKVRVETEKDGRTLVQATDGKNPPWEFDTGHWPPQYHDMAADVAKTFTADAEFDDPLVAGSARGFSVDYAGEVAASGKKLIRLLVTQNLTESFSLLLDPDTYFIVRRVEERKNALGNKIFVVTYYADYRPVEGVLVPHKIALVSDDRVVQETQIDSIQGNPEIAPDTFTRPAAAGK